MLTGLIHTTEFVQMAEQQTETFGQRLARLRNERNLSQRDLAELAGISHRMIAYYEVEAKNMPPSDKVFAIAKALDLTPDQLLGLKSEPRRKPHNSKLWKSFQELQRLPKRDQQVVLGMIDTYVKERVGST